MRATSISLDVLRAAAAVTVFLHHANWLRLDDGLLAAFHREVGHSAVTVFFVLSGFVIAASTERTRSLADYAIKRAARVYSVAVPALVLTLALDLIASELALPVNLPDYELRKPILYLAVHLCFAGDLWSLGVPAFSNNPYWSLNYEVWYYVAFGVATYLRGATRWIVVALVLLVMGPKLWLLLPIWLAGVGIYELQKRATLPRAAARAVALGAGFLLLLSFALPWVETVSAVGVGVAASVVPFALRFSQWFLADYITGVITAALVWALCSADFAIPRLVAALGTGLAKVSFSLYLVHFPLLQFLGALMPPGFGPVAIVATFGIALAFGAVFEPQRERLRRAMLAAT